MIGATQHVSTSARYPEAERRRRLPQRRGAIASPWRLRSRSTLRQLCVDSRTPPSMARDFFCPRSLTPIATSAQSRRPRRADRNRCRRSTHPPVFVESGAAPALAFVAPTPLDPRYHRGGQPRCGSADQRRRHLAHVTGAARDRRQHAPRQSAPGTQRIQLVKSWCPASQSQLGCQALAKHLTRLQHRRASFAAEALRYIAT
jgi:hypothetical protein